MPSKPPTKESIRLKTITECWWTIKNEVHEHFFHKPAHTDQERAARNTALDAVRQCMAVVNRLTKKPASRAASGPSLGRKRAKDAASVAAVTHTAVLELGESVMITDNSKIAVALHQIGLPHGSVDIQRLLESFRKAGLDLVEAKKLGEIETLLIEQHSRQRALDEDSRAKGIQIKDLTEARDAQMLELGEQARLITELRVEIDELKRAS